MGKSKTKATYRDISRTLGYRYIFRTPVYSEAIFRILVYSEPVLYSEASQTSTISFSRSLLSEMS